MKRLGEKLRTLRKQKGFTQVQLGKMLDVDHSHIVKIEKGQRLPSLDMLVKITQVFNVGCDQLIMDDQELDN